MVSLLHPEYNGVAVAVAYVAHVEKFSTFCSAVKLFLGCEVDFFYMHCKNGLTKIRHKMLTFKYTNIDIYIKLNLFQKVHKQKQILFYIFFFF